MKPHTKNKSIFIFGIIFIAIGILYIFNFFPGITGLSIFEPQESNLGNISGLLFIIGGIGTLILSIKKINQK